MLSLNVTADYLTVPYEKLLEEMVEHIAGIGCAFNYEFMRCIEPKHHVAYTERISI
jgi:hypothetical protein